MATIQRYTRERRPRDLALHEIRDSHQEELIGMTFHQDPPFKNLGLRLADDPSKQTPDSLRHELSNIGLNCDDLSDRNLQNSIDTVRDSFTSTPEPCESYLIAEPGSGSDFSAGRVVAGVRDLLPDVQRTNRYTQTLVSYLASTKPGTRAYIDELFTDDTTAQDIRDQITQSHEAAGSFLSEVGDTGADRAEFLQRLEEFDSAPLRQLGGLAAAELQPAAVGKWIAYGAGVPFEKQLFDIAHNWTTVEQKLGSQFLGRQNDWPDKNEPYTSFEAFEQLFISVAVQASASLAPGLDDVSTEALLTNRIKQSEGLNPDNYDSGDPEKNPLLVFLAVNYDKEKNEADDLGFVNVKYEITVKDYRKKSKYDHDRKTHITGYCQSCLFYDIPSFNAHIVAAGDQPIS